MTRVLPLVIVFFMLVNPSAAENKHKTKESADSEVERLLKEIKELPEGPERADTLLEIVKIYRKNKPEISLKYARQCLMLCKKIKYAQGTSECFYYMGIVSYFKGEYQLALDYNFKTLNIKETLGDKIGISRTYNILGLIYFRQSNLRKSLESYNKSKSIAAQLGDKVGVSHSYNNLGLLFSRQGNFSKALEYYFKSLKIYEELDNKISAVSVYNNIGLIYYNMENYEKALEYHFISLKANREVGDIQGSAHSYNNIGIVYEQQKRYSQALEYHFKGLKLLQEIGSKSGLSNSYFNIGQIYQLQRKYNLALQYYLKSLKISEEIGKKYGIANSYYGIGSCYRLMNKPQKAIESLLQALRIPVVAAPIIKRDVSRDLSEIYVGLKQYQQAYKYHVMFKEKSDFLRNDENLKKSTQLEMQYQFDKKQKQQEMLQQQKDLEKKTELQQQRFFKYAFSGIAIILALVFYTRFRLKVKVNRHLRREIHDRKLAESELLKSMKLETLGILAAGIAHDFNNLLTVIEGSLSMAQECLEDPDPNIEPFVEAAHKSTLQATELVKNFLFISESGFARKEKLLFRDIVDKSLANAAQSREVPLEVALTGDLHAIFGEKRQLRRVLVNLLTNAHEAAVHKGPDEKTTLSGRNISLSTDNRWALKEGEYIHVSVTDNGTGIPADILDKIFDPYFSTKERGVQKGMGLSLSVCAAIIRSHGGEIEIHSKPGEGTIVDFYLPVFNEMPE